jgi:hypothetical protein
MVFQANSVNRKTSKGPCMAIVVCTGTIAVDVEGTIVIVQVPLLLLLL